MTRPDPPFSVAEEEAARRLIELALAEDGARDDVTTELCIPPATRGRAVIRSREEGVLAGLPCVSLCVEIFGADLTVHERRHDGDAVAAGEVVAELEGSMAHLLSIERTFLNLLCSLSGVATLTHRFVERAGPRCRVLDTRKTWPAWRVLQKYAVRCGGGVNHRMGLYDAFMFKDNHQAGGVPLERIVEQARQRRPELPVIVEVDDLQSLRRVLPLGVDRILLDNFDPAAVREACLLRKEAGVDVPFEISGGVNLDTVGALAEAGADMVSVGAITHSAPALDLGLDLQ